MPCGLFGGGRGHLARDDPAWDRSRALHRHARGHCRQHHLGGDTRTPVPLGRKVDDQTRTGQSGRSVGEDPPYHEVAALAGVRVGGEVVRECALEFQRDALAHHPDGVDRVDQRIGLG
jgi:hypothetical protein